MHWGRLTILIFSLTLLASPPVRADDSENGGDDDDQETAAEHVDAAKLTKFESIKIQDSTDDVLKLMGAPDSSGPSKRIYGGAAWYYEMGDDLCGLTIYHDKVQAKQCSASADTPEVKPTPAQNVLKAVGTILQGAGQGLQQAPRNNVNCTSTQTGGTTFTQCH